MSGNKIVVQNDGSNADVVRVLVLDNFTVENITHYDFYWYAIWTDADAEQQFLEETLLNRDFAA